MCVMVFAPWGVFLCGFHASLHARLSALFYQFLDYQNYIRSCCMKDIPAMERSIALCNGISQWVQLMVLSRPTAQLRAEVFTKFIYVAEVAVESFTPPPPSLTKKERNAAVYLCTSFSRKRKCLLLRSAAFRGVHWRKAAAESKERVPQAQRFLPAGR